MTRWASKVWQALAAQQDRALSVPSAALPMPNTLLPATPCNPSTNHPHKPPPPPLTGSPA